MSDNGLAISPAAQDCLILLKQVEADINAGKVDSIAIVACGPTDFGANLAGPNAVAINLGLDVLKARVIANVTDRHQVPAKRPKPSVIHRA